MANKYLIHGATYDGDGTASNEAASAGAAGAWNNINKLTGTTPTYGAVNNGDTVHIRSKTSGGADITVSVSGSTNIGKSGLTAGQRVRWELDNGTIWSGIDGTLTFTKSSDVALNLLAYNTLEAKSQDKVLFNFSTITSSTTAFVQINDGSVLRKARLDNSALTGSYGTGVWLGGTTEGVLDRCSFYLRKRYLAAMRAGNFTSLHVVSPDIEIIDATETGAVFAGGDYGGQIQVVGGRLYGAGVYAGLSLSQPASYNSSVRTIGFAYDKSIVVSTSPVAVTAPSTEVSSLGADGVMGSTLRTWSMLLDSRDYIHLPRLNAVTPGASPVAWSIRVAPASTTSEGRAARLPPVAKMFEDTAAAITLTQELLVETGFSEINADTAYLLVAYTDDSTGAAKAVSSKVTGSLASSTALWSATTYGTESFSKYKIEVTTPTSVKQYTPIFAQLVIEAPASIATKYLIVCPDVQIA